MEQDKGHRSYYNKNGELIPSVTTLLKIFGKDLTGWANWLGKQNIDVKSYVNKKAEFGTYIHSLAERYFTGDLTVLINDKKYLKDEEYKCCIERFDYLMSSMTAKGFEVYGCEIVLDGDKYGGTADIVFYNKEKDKYVLLDFKTSKAVQPSMFIQLGGYTSLFQEVKDIHIDVVGIVLITKSTDDPSFLTLKSTKDNMHNQQIFTKLSDIYYLMDAATKQNLQI